MLVRCIRHDEATPWRPDGTCGIGMRPSAKPGRRPYGGTERAWPACSHCKYLKLTGTRRKARARETWKPAVRAERPVPAPLSNLHFRTLPSKKFRVGHKNRKGLYWKKSGRKYVKWPNFETRHRVEFEFLRISRGTAKRTDPTGARPRVFEARSTLCTSYISPIVYPSAHPHVSA